MELTLHEILLGLLTTTGTHEILELVILLLITQLLLDILESLHLACIPGDLLELLLLLELKEHVQLLLILTRVTPTSHGHTIEILVIHFGLIYYLWCSVFIDYLTNNNSVDFSCFTLIEILINYNFDQFICLYTQNIRFN